MGTPAYLEMCSDHYESMQYGPEVIKLFSCSDQLSMKFSLLINMKMPTIVKFSCSAMDSKKDFAIVSNLGFISKTNFMLS